MNPENIFFNSINQISIGKLTDKDVDDFFGSATLLLQKVSKQSKARDNFTPYYYQPTIVLTSFLKSEKTNSEYNLSYDFFKNEIVFHSSIKYWENIKNIDDLFWNELLEITKKYDIKFKSYSGPFYQKDKTPEFNANYKSLIYNIMSVYITAMLETKEDRQNISFGQLEIVWTAKQSIDDILEQLPIAFKLFYRFNYLLWKSEDIRQQNQNNRKRKSAG